MEPVTLLLTALTPRYIVQVSDRRVVRRHVSGRLDKKDGHIKAIVTPHCACCYTGLAELGHGDTADWIATELSDHVHDSDFGLAALQAAARETVKSIRQKDRRLDIVLAGWMMKSDRSMKPYAIVVSNASPTGAVSGDFASTCFYVKETRNSAVLPAGQMLRDTEWKQVSRVVEKLCASGRDSARGLAHVLIQCVLSVARRADRGEYVSEDVLIVSLPRLDLVSAPLVVGKLVNNYWSVTCVNGAEPKAERHGGPIIVGDRSAIQALPPEADPPGTGDFCGARIVRKPEDGKSIEMFLLTKPPLAQAWGFPGIRTPLKARPT